MVTIRCKYLIDLPSLDARKLAKLCKRNEETHECPVDWGKIPCLLPGEYCSEITANDWKKFLKDTKVVEEETDADIQTKD